MALTLFWRCESATLDGTDDYSAGATSLTAVGAVSLSATAKKVGSYGIINTDAGDYYTCSPASFFSDSYANAGTVGFWANPRSSVNNGGSPFIFCVEEYPYGSTDNWVRTEVSSGGVRLAMREGTQDVLNLFTSASILSTTNWYFFVCSWDKANDKRRIRIYDSDGDLVEAETEDTTTDLSAYLNAGPMDQLNLGGQRSTGTTPVTWSDNIFIGNSYNDADLIYANRNITSYTEWSSGTGSPLILPHRSSGGMIDLSGNFRG